MSVLENAIGIETEIVTRINPITQEPYQVKTYKGALHVEKRAEAILDETTKDHLPTLEHQMLRLMKYAIIEKTLEISIQHMQWEGVSLYETPLFDGEALVIIHPKDRENLVELVHKALRIVPHE